MIQSQNNAPLGRTCLAGRQASRTRKPIRSGVNPWFSRCRDKIKSMTLIETLLYIALASVIILAVSLLTVMITQVRTRNKTISEVENQGAQLMRTMTQSIRGARGVNSPLPGASATTLSLAEIIPAKNPTVFEAAGDAINIKEGQSEQTALISSTVKISDLTFSNISPVSENGLPGSVKIQFTVKYNSSDPRYEFNFQKTFYGTAALRNSP